MTSITSFSFSSDIHVVKQNELKMLNRIREIFPLQDKFIPFLVFIKLQCHLPLWCSFLKMSLTDTTLKSDKRNNKSIFPCLMFSKEYTSTGEQNYPAILFLYEQQGPIRVVNWLLMSYGFDEGTSSFLYEDTDILRSCNYGHKVSNQLERSSKGPNTFWSFLWS